MKTQRNYTNLARATDKELCAIIMQDLNKFRAEKANGLTGETSTGKKSQKLVA